MEKLYNSNKNANEDGIHTRLKINKNVRDPAIVQTKGDHGNTINSKVKDRQCSNCKDVGYTSAHVHLPIFNKVNMLIVTTYMNLWNILHQMQLLAHLIQKYIIIVFFNRKMSMGYQTKYQVFFFQLLAFLLNFISVYC